MAKSGAERAAAYYNRQQAKRHDEVVVLQREIAALRRQVDDRDVEVAALEREVATLRIAYLRLIRRNRIVPAEPL
jgi:hypothetical protein